MQTNAQSLISNIRQYLQSVRRKQGPSAKNRRGLSDAERARKERERAQQAKAENAKDTERIADLKRTKQDRDFVWQRQTTTSDTAISDVRKWIQKSQQEIKDLKKARALEANQNARRAPQNSSSFCVNSEMRLSDDERTSQERAKKTRAFKIDTKSCELEKHKKDLDEQLSELAEAKRIKDADDRRDDREIRRLQAAIRRRDPDAGQYSEWEAAAERVRQQIEERERREAAAKVAKEAEAEKLRKEREERERKDALAKEGEEEEEEKKAAAKRQRKQKKREGHRMRQEKKPAAEAQRRQREREQVEAEKRDEREEMERICEEQQAALER